MNTMDHSQTSKRTLNLISRIGRSPKLKTVLLTALFSTVYALFLARPFTGEWFLKFLIDWTLILCQVFASLGIAYRFFIPYLKNKPAKELKRVILPAFGFFMLVVFVACLLINMTLLCIFNKIGGGSFSEFIEIMSIVSIWKIVEQYFVWVLAGMAFFFYLIWYQTATREQHLKEENLLYRYKTLKTQVNPHFLFNSLNTLSEMVYEDPKKADRYIQELSGVYRYILDHEETDWVPLNEELDFIKQYFDLQEERAEGKIRLQIEIQDAYKFKIIPVSLQILVENAIKHNSASEEAPLRIRIYKAGSYVIVSNTLQKKSILHDSSRTGLPNLGERMRLLTGKEMIVNQENNLFTVQLPLLKAEK